MEMRIIPCYDGKKEKRGTQMELVNGLDYPREIGELFAEYTEMLVAGDPSFAYYLELQDYDDELRHLERKYGPPRSRLILAVENGEAAGCIALREMDAARCELKRLYVRPAFRGRGLGRRLTETVIAAAREIGYREMLLDTLPFLREAQRLYRSVGFREIEKYNNSPMDGATYMKLELQQKIDEIGKMC